MLCKMKHPSFSVQGCVGCFHFLLQNYYNIFVFERKISKAKKEQRIQRKVRNPLPTKVSEINFQPAVL